MAMLALNPIRRGDRAFAVGFHGEIDDVKDDLVLFRPTKRPIVNAADSSLLPSPEWRHWTNCLYGAEVISRIVLAPQHEGVDELGYCMKCWQYRGEITDSECTGPKND